MKKARQGRTEKVEQGRVEQGRVEQVSASFIEGNKRRYEFLPERSRYLTLSDGQVFDRTNQPIATKTLPGIKAANDAYFGIIREERGILHALVDPGKRRKLEKICQSLKEHNVLSEVRYGVTGPTFDIVAELLEVT